MAINKTISIFHCDACGSEMPLSEARTHLKTRHNIPLEVSRKAQAQATMHADSEDEFITSYIVLLNDKRIGTRKDTTPRDKNDPMRSQMSL